MSVVSEGIRDDVRDMRRAIIQRLLDADATSPQKTLAIAPDSLTSDERSLLDDFVRRGVVVEDRGEYYVVQEELDRAARRSSWDLVIWLVIVVGIIGAMMWFVGAKR